jgi:hypothetical protein
VYPIASYQLVNIHMLGLRGSELPAEHERQGLRVGAAVRIALQLPWKAEQGKPDREQVWLVVTDVSSGRYVGRLDGDPKILTHLKSGLEIAFGPEHVAFIYPDKP